MNVKSASTEKGKKYAQIAEGQVCVFTGNEKHNAGRVTARRSVSTENGSQRAGNAALNRFANTIDKSINVSSVEPSKFANIKRGLGIAKYVTREVDVHTIDARVPVSNAAAVTFVPTIESGASAMTVVAVKFVPTIDSGATARTVTEKTYAFIGSKSLGAANARRLAYQDAVVRFAFMGSASIYAKNAKDLVGANITDQRPSVKSATAVKSAPMGFERFTAKRVTAVRYVRRRCVRYIDRIQITRGTVSFVSCICTQMSRP
jgi:hypothetical protein